MSNPKRGIRVLGTCQAGHTTEAEAPPKRVTWRGTCSHDDCDLPVVCRRAPRDTPAAKAAADAKPVDVDDQADTDPYTVKKVTSYERKQQPRKRVRADVPQPRPDSGRGDGGGDQPARQPEREPEPARDPEPVEQPRGRLTFRQRVADRRERRGPKQRPAFLTGILG